MPLSVDYANAALTFLLTDGSVHLWASLHTAEPVFDGASNEVTGVNYARESLDGVWDTPGERATTNGVDVSFPVAGDEWGTVTHFGLYNDETAGDLVWYTEMTPEVTVHSGDSLTLPSGNLNAEAA